MKMLNMISGRCLKIKGGEFHKALLMQTNGISKLVKMDLSMKFGIEQILIIWLVKC